MEDKRWSEIYGKAKEIELEIDKMVVMQTYYETSNQRDKISALLLDGLMPMIKKELPPAPREDTQGVDEAVRKAARKMSEVFCNCGSSCNNCEFVKPILKDLLSQRPAENKAVEALGALKDKFDDGIDYDTKDINAIIETAIAEERKR